MAVFLAEADVTRLLSMRETIDAVEEGFRSLGNTEGAMNHARHRFFLPHGVFHHMEAVLPAKGVMGLKAYTSFGGAARFYVLLFSSESGELLAFVEADRLGQLRTGAATGVAAKYLARKDAAQVALLGAGGQAATQAEALRLVLPNLTEFRVFSRDAAKRQAFCAERSATLGLPFLAAGSVAEAVNGADIVVCATNSPEPILMADMLSPGAFIAAIGANRVTARELEDEVVGRADMIIVDDVTQAMTEAAELIFAAERRRFFWERAIPLSQIVVGNVSPRTSPIHWTLFKSLGIALEDVAAANAVYEKAILQGVGQELPTGG